MTYDRPLTALLVIDPYNDFISEGDQIWDRVKTVAEANGCVPNMLRVMHTALEVNLPNYANAVATADQVIESLAAFS